MEEVKEKAGTADKAGRGKCLMTLPFAKECQVGAAGAVGAVAGVRGAC